MPRKYIGETVYTSTPSHSAYDSKSGQFYTMLYVGCYIDNCARNKRAIFKILPFYKIQTDNKFKENKKEIFINLLKANLIIYLNSFVLLTTICMKKVSAPDNVISTDAKGMYYLF